MLTTIGLSVICIAWLFQAIIVLVKRVKKVGVAFIGIYSIGVLLIVIDGFTSGMILSAWFNLIVLFLAIAVLISLKNR